ncbi:MAG: prepilin-type N-terminal cleavage/methylation domain-containing protein [Leptolyngbya sp. SIO4C1]|nr:prepilin-type N-terminal cleavage/methylation domain-containing protein [Leptolyngbya sp. SIO4C1]
MKSSFITKLLQHLAKKKQEGGFTLIELLVVIIIIGILAAIALPSFLNQANKAKQSEAKTYTGSMNRAQQAYYLENGEFAPPTSFNELGLGIASQTENYDYSIVYGSASQVGSLGAPRPNKDSIKQYVGLVNVGTTTGTATGEATTLAALCEAKAAPINNGPRDLEPANVTSAAPAGNAAPSCDDLPNTGGGYKNLGK